jgi:3'-phosphoadenosine 5'-phosphosulfate sulfotransferase (PAPS reductase)/FAD synthetase
MVFVSEIKQLEGREKVMWQREFDGVEGSGMPETERRNCDNNRPWIIGFSGGKDSTVLLTLVWMALIKIREGNPDATLKRQVYLVCNDTMVENPVIEEYVSNMLHRKKFNF